MVGVPQHFEDLAHDAPFLFDRLIGIGVGADGDWPDLVIRSRQFALQEPRGIRLGEELRLEIQTRRQAHEGVCGAGETIDAAVLASAIGVDRTVKGDIGRFISGDHRPRLLDLDFGLEGGQIFQAFPAVVEAFPRLRLEAAGRVEPGAASAAAVDIDPQACCAHHRFGDICRIGGRKRTLPDLRQLVHWNLPGIRSLIPFCSDYFPIANTRTIQEQKAGAVRLEFRAPRFGFQPSQQCM
ncbi:hypothetical protein D9M72_478870 [compost metagenome]